MNPVISREYVEKHYIKKDKLERFIDREIKAIDKCKKDPKLTTKFQLDGMRAAYVAIKNIMLEEKNAADSIYNTWETSRKSKT